MHFDRNGRLFFMILRYFLSNSFFILDCISLYNSLKYPAAGRSSPVFVDRNFILNLAGGRGISSITFNNETFELPVILAISSASFSATSDNCDLSYGTSIFLNYIGYLKYLIKHNLDLSNGFLICTILRLRPK